MTIVIEFFFFIVMCLNFSINVQQVVLLFQKAIRPILCALARPPFKGTRVIGLAAGRGGFPNQECMFCVPKFIKIVNTKENF